MTSLILVVALVACAVVTNQAAPGDTAPPPSTEVVEAITPGKFEDWIQEHNQTLVEFYAPWCGHCKKLAPEYEKAAVSLRDSHGIALAKLDATEDKETATKFGVKGFPTMIWFDQGKDTEFDGGRTFEAIVEWVGSMTGEPVAEVVELPVNKGEKPFVVLYAPTKLEAYDNAAKENRRKATWHFVVTAGEPKVTLIHAWEAPVELTAAEMSAEMESQSEASVEATGEASVEVTPLTPEQRSQKNIVKFLDAHIMPRFGKLYEKNWEKYQELGLGMIWTLFRKPEDGTTVLEKHGPMMTEVAAAPTVHGRYWVTYTDVETNLDQLDAMLAVKETEFPLIVLQKRAGDKVKFVYSGEMTASNILKFVDEVAANITEPRLRTEPVPAKNDGEVRIVVSTTMKEEIYDDDKDVLFFVHAPWCGHCKKFDPEFSRLAKKLHLEGFDDVVKLAKIDGTANDSPIEEIDWLGFPTIYLVPAGSDNVTVYDGDRTAKGLWKHVRKFGTHAAMIRERMETLKETKRAAGEL